MRTHEVVPGAPGHWRRGAEAVGHGERGGDSEMEGEGAQRLCLGHGWWVTSAAGECSVV